MQCSRSAFDERPLMTEKLQRVEVNNMDIIMWHSGSNYQIWIVLNNNQSYPPIYDRPVALHRPLQINKTWNFQTLQTEMPTLYVLD